MLYRKYRPQTFDDVIGQEHVVRTIQGALLTDRIGHAYLFTGSRGTGKTTMARLLAKALNCIDFSKFREKGLRIPCDKCESCQTIKDGRSMALIEIDAASNRGIDEIRDIKESAGVAASGGRYKVFIIDEAHMLTMPAFNALLKILEEPSSHVVFVLATTEPHKIPETVLSRVQRFDFKKLNAKQIFTKLKLMARVEGLNIDEGGLKSIAISYKGALRDAEVALSKVAAWASRGLITEEDTNNILGLIPVNYYSKFFDFMANKDKESALRFIHNIYESGIDMESFSRGFTAYLRKIMVYKINPAILVSSGENINGDEVLLSHSATDSRMLIKMLNRFSAVSNEIKQSPIPQLPLELAVLELADLP